MRILAALSGGVDSAVAAARLLRAGAEVVGVHLRTGVEADAESAGGSRSCCGADDARDARRVAHRLGIPFSVVAVRDAFEHVIEDFVTAYAAGLTPHPCVLCNAGVKFGRLREIGERFDCEALATGHYARVERGPTGRYRLLRAEDPTKDQSYVLYRLDQAQLAASRFPLGTARSKDEVRDEARALGLDVAAKPDSQDLCFVPRGDYRTFLHERAPDAMVPGRIVDHVGRELGRHDGAAGFTVGQRRRLPAVGSPRYVQRVEPATGTVHVAPREGVLASGAHVEDVRWIEVEPPAPGTVFRVRARIRHASRPQPARLEVGAGGATRVEVAFDEPAFAPAPGQSLVAYVGDAVLCGGTLCAPAEPGKVGGNAV